VDPAPANIELFRIGAGAVALIHRPKIKLLPRLKAAGVTHLVTLLSRREGALVMGSAAKAAELEWIWVELEPEPARPRYLITEPGIGYRFTPQGRNQST
jgi:hypothetical protein